MKQKEKAINKTLKIDILTTSLIAVLKSFDFQNEFTTQRKVETLKLFAVMIKKQRKTPVKQ